ncbi:glycosyltransferase 61 family protein [Azospirillum tabaci]|uniref:glycosyltransferase 61 family protein n=1 Tax=Azospirillum tabaci TaxID=2752310 RepID=UPI0016601D6D
MLNTTATAPAASIPTAEVQVDYDDDGFSGWVVSSAGPYAPVWCQVLIDGEHRASIRADEFVPFVGERHDGHCCLNFSYRVPAYLRDGRAHRVQLTFTYVQDNATVQCSLPLTVRTFGAAASHPQSGYSVCRAQDVAAVPADIGEAESRASPNPIIVFPEGPIRRVWRPCRDVDGAALSGFPHAEIVTHPPAVSFLSDVYVRRSTGAVYVPGHGVWQDSHYLSDSRRIREDLERLERGGLDAPIIEGPALLASTAMNRNYFHWVMDILAGVHACTRHLGPPPPLLTPPLRSWQADSLRLLVGDAAFATPADGAEPASDLVRCRRLIVPSNLGGVGLFPDETVTDLFATLRGRVGHDPHARRRIFISRRDSDCPRITNEAVFAAALERFGFETVVLGERSFAEQVRLFKEAEVVIGAHGAGLVNGGFCTPGTWMVEIRSSNYLNPCFYHLSGVCGLSYASHVETVPHREDGAENAASFEVGTERLLDLLRRLPLKFVL